MVQYIVSRSWLLAEHRNRQSWRKEEMVQGGIDVACPIFSWAWTPPSASAQQRHSRFT